MHFLDPSFSSHLLSPPPTMTEWLTIRHTIGGHISPSPQPAPSDLCSLIRISQEVNNEWRSPSGAANSILLCVTFHPRPFTTLLLNIRYNPLKYQRLTNHINVDIACPGPRAYYTVNTELKLTICSTFWFASDSHPSAPPLNPGFYFYIFFFFILIVNCWIVDLFSLVLLSGTELPTVGFIELILKSEHSFILHFKTVQ